ncbi:MAG: 23S rRNA (adenine(2503)-C(2))-methyltransferase RlmN [Planctomycetaceae bacterium]
MSSAPTDRSSSAIAPPDAPPPPSLASLTPLETEALCRSLGEPPYRARQLTHWVQTRFAADYDAMSDLPMAFRERLRALLPVRASTVAHARRSEDGTTKLLLRMTDGEQVECVLIPEADRFTACLSTQVGCGVGCVFCASGTGGLRRNLTHGEIVEQALHLSSVAGARLTNLVVMGMGEPLHNVEELGRALRILMDPAGFDLGSRRITVSTSGVRRGFDQFLRLGFKVGLAISLHSPHDPQRRELVPRGGSGTVLELREMALRWFRATGRDVTFEVVLLAGRNDSDADARALAVLAGRHINVNLIPMNPVAFAPALRAPSPERVEAFTRILRERGVVVHVRRQRGDDVAAACGQLRLHEAARA